MRVKIDLDLCQGHAMCHEEAPEIFRVVQRDDGYDVVEIVLEHPPESLREKLEAARRYCPNRVISIEDG